VLISWAHWAIDRRDEVALKPRICVRVAPSACVVWSLRSSSAERRVEFEGLADTMTTAGRRGRHSDTRLSTGVTADTGDGRQQSVTRELPAAVVKTRGRVAARLCGEPATTQPPSRSFPDTGFEYTFGSPVPAAPIAYWQDLERTTGERPLDVRSRRVLRMPYTLSRGLYFWPFAYDVASVDDLTAHERELLRRSGRSRASSSRARDTSAGGARDPA
jgi:hypothetical protein